MIIIFITQNIFKIKIGIILISISIYSCSSYEKKNNISNAEKKFYNGIGVGPINELELDDAINMELSAQGEKVYQSKCITCHTVSDEKRIGPGLKGITLRRRPEWIMNQILNPLEMTKSDSLSKELLSIYLTQMTNMSLTQDDARSVLEYFRQLEKK